MASLLFAASFLTINKIKDKRTAKKEAKRRGYETRYNELEREHTHDQEKHIQRQQSGGSREAESNAQPTPVSKVHDPLSEHTTRPRSNDSRRASTESRDDPSAWVDDLVKERSKTGNAGHL